MTLSKDFLKRLTDAIEAADGEEELLRIQKEAFPKSEHWRHPDHPVYQTYNRLISRWADVTDLVNDKMASCLERMGLPFMRTHNGGDDEPKKAAAGKHGHGESHVCPSFDAWLQDLTAAMAKASVNAPGPGHRPSQGHTSVHPVFLGPQPMAKSAGHPTVPIKIGRITTDGKNSPGYYLYPYTHNGMVPKKDIVVEDPKTPKE